MESIPFRPEEHAVYDDGKMGKSTLFQSDRLLVGRPFHRHVDPMFEAFAKLIDPRYELAYGLLQIRPGNQIGKDML